MSSRCRFAGAIIGNCTRAGNEVSWWETLKISPIEIAKSLWEESHGRELADSNVTAQADCISEPSKTQP